MFRTAKPGRQRAAEGFDAAITAWRDTSDNWFDGTVQSIDNRLRRCARLINQASSQIAHGPAGESRRYLSAYQELSADKQALAGLRDDMLTGSFGREAGVSPPGRTAAKTATPKLAGQDQRWVDLESARFLQANIDAAHLAEELSERARRYAEHHTSALGRARSRAMTAAFVDKVVELGRATPRPRTASAPAAIPDFDDTLMFL